MLRVFWIFYTVLLFSFSPSWGEDKLAPSRLPLTVFLVHGMGGDETTFCDLKSVLETYYHERSLNKTPFYVHPIRYSTHTEGLRPIEFKAELNQQIVDFYIENKLPSHAPYMIIAHSQGGVVGMRYFIDCLWKRRCGGDKAHLTPGNFKRLITLGSPFWGSPVASSISEGGFIKDFLAGLSGAKLAQVKALAQGSIPLTNMRKRLLQIFSRPEALAKKGLSDFEVHNIAGEISQASWFGGLTRMFLSGSMPWEFDAVVDSASARLSFLYHIENSVTGGYKKGQLQIPGRYYSLTRPHIELNDVNGLACVKRGPEVFLKNPVLPIILSVIEGYFDQKRYDPRLVSSVIRNTTTELKNFSVETKLNLPLNYDRELKVNFDQEIKISKPEGEKSIQNAVLPSSFIAKYSGFNENDTRVIQKRFMTYFHHGSFYGLSSQRFHDLTQKINSGELNRNQKQIYSSSYLPVFDDQESLSLKGGWVQHDIQIPGWERKQVQLQVRPAFSSYVEVHLKPIYAYLRPGKSVVVERARLRQQRTGQTERPAQAPVLDGRFLKMDGQQKRLFAFAALRQFDPYWGDSSKENSLLVFYVDLDDSSFPVTRTSYSLNHFKDKIRPYSQNIEDMMFLKDGCFIGKVGSLVGRHRGELFDSFNQEKGKSGFFSEGDEVRVIGRLAWQGNLPEERDRYFVWLGENRYGWVNVVDIDLDTRYRRGRLEVRKCVN